MPKSTRGFQVSDEVREIQDQVEHEVSLQLGRYSKSELRRMQKVLRNEIFYRTLERMKSKYKKEIAESIKNS